MNEKDKNPGPGSYKDNVKVEKKLKGNKIQKFGTNSKRMFQVNEKPDEVGPGKYQRNEIIQEDIKDARFGQIKQTSSNFRSSTGRDCFGENRRDSFPFA